MSNKRFDSSANVMPMMEKMIMQVMQKNGMLTGNKTFGVVVEAQNESTLLVEMQQSGKQELVNCTPSIDFLAGDRVIIEYINSNPHDKFVMAVLSRGVEGIVPDPDDPDDPDDPVQPDPIDYAGLPDEPVEIFRNDENEADYFLYGYNDPETTWSQRLVKDEDSGLLKEVVHEYPDGFTMSRMLIRDEEDRLERYE